MENLKNEILEAITPISKGMSQFEFKVVSWPFSRELIKTVLAKQDVTDYKYHRLNKLHEVFEFEASEKTEEALNKTLSIFKKSTKNLSAKQKLKLVKDLELGTISVAQTLEPTSDKSYGGISCPSCNSSHVTKNGKDPKGVQKYKCKDCGNNFK